MEAGSLTLEQRVAPLLDPSLLQLGLGSLTTLFGANASHITVEHLATMTSGVPDFDTATPNVPPTDAFRAAAYAEPALEHPPAALLNLSWVRKGTLDFFPGKGYGYSSTNFVLLGLMLSRLGGASRWDGTSSGTRSPPTRLIGATLARLNRPPLKTLP